MSELVVSWKNVRLTRSDVELLRDGQWLNDECVTFFLEYLKHGLSEGEARILFLGAETAFWFLMEDDAEDLEDAVNGLELRRRELVLFPVNDNTNLACASGGSHWSLLVGRRVDSTMTFEHYDSMSSSNLATARRLAAKVSKLLGGARRPEVRTVETAQQHNSYDCGVYVLLCAQEVVEAFLEGRVPKVRDFRPTDASAKRKELQGIVAEASRQGKAVRQTEGGPDKPVQEELEGSAQRGGSAQLESSA